MNDISTIAKCHPMEYCFEECACTDCTNEWHLYDMVRNRPIKDLEICDAVNAPNNIPTTKELRKMKKNRVPAICERNGEYKGVIETEEQYESWKKGEIDFNESIKSRITHVSLPYAVVMRLMKIDRTLDEFNAIPNNLTAEDFRHAEN